jgi:hypothetical protein
MEANAYSELTRNSFRRWASQPSLAQHQPTLKTIAFKKGLEFNEFCDFSQVSSSDAALVSALAWSITLLHTISPMGLRPQANGEIQSAHVGPSSSRWLRLRLYVSRLYL